MKLISNTTLQKKHKERKKREREKKIQKQKTKENKYAFLTKYCGNLPIIFNYFPKYP